MNFFALFSGDIVFVMCSAIELKCAFLCPRCWLSVDNHFIWSFIGPVTFIIMVSCLISLRVLRLTEWGKAWEAEMKEMKEGDGGSEMLELKEKSPRFLLHSLRCGNRLILRQRQILRYPTILPASYHLTRIRIWKCTLTIYATPMKSHVTDVAFLW